MNTAIACHVFIQWLASKDVLNQWMDAILNTYEDGYTDCPLENFLTELQALASNRNNFTYEWLIIAMPSWNILSEGEAFWNTLDNEWQNIVEEIKNDYIDSK